MTGTVAVAFTVAGMHCASCGLLIDDTLEDLPGVAGAATDTRAGRTVVEVDLATTSISDIVAAITATGYTAEPDLSAT